MAIYYNTKTNSFTPLASILAGALERNHLLTVKSSGRVLLSIRVWIILLCCAFMFSSFFRVLRVYICFLCNFFVAVVVLLDGYSFYLYLSCYIYCITYNDFYFTARTCYTKSTIQEYNILLYKHSVWCLEFTKARVLKIFFFVVSFSKKCNTYSDFLFVSYIFYSIDVLYIIWCIHYLWIILHVIYNRNILLKQSTYIYVIL